MPFAEGLEDSESALDERIEKGGFTGVASCDRGH